jgi:threonine/homoserine/homoserine lactone efflux protein
MMQSSLLEIFIFAFAVSIGAVVSPGPVSAAIITETPRKGWRAGPLIATGHILLELIFIGLISIGLSTVLASDEIQRVIAIGGSLLLFYMGGNYLALVFRKKAKLPAPNHMQGSSQASNLILLGMFTTISNPFWYAWWATIVPGYLGKNLDLNLMTIAVFYLGHISTDYLWDTFLSAVIFSGRRWLSDRSYAILILLTGGFMVYLGVDFLRLGMG